MIIGRAKTKLTCLHSCSVQRLWRIGPEDRRFLSHNALRQAGERIQVLPGVMWKVRRSSNDSSPLPSSYFRPSAGVTANENLQQTYNITTWSRHFPGWARTETGKLYQGLNFTSVHIDLDYIRAHTRKSTFSITQMFADSFLCFGQLIKITFSIPEKLCCVVLSFKPWKALLIQLSFGTTF